jgi:hypothetical protein
MIMHTSLNYKPDVICPQDSEMYKVNSKLLGFSYNPPYICINR